MGLMPPTLSANPLHWPPNTRSSPQPGTSEGPCTWALRAGEATHSGALLESGSYSQACPAAELAPAAVLCHSCLHCTIQVAVVQQKGTWELGVRLWDRPDPTLVCPSPPFSCVVLLLLLLPLPMVYNPKSPAAFPVAFSKISRSHNTDCAPSSSGPGQNSPGFMSLSQGHEVF